MMFRRLKQNIMVKTGRASQTAFPPEVDKGISFCEASKKDVNNILKSVQSMVASFSGRGLSPHETFGGAMKEANSTFAELGRVERKSYDDSLNQFVNGFAKDWLKNGVAKQLDDISELKKRRLEKDACATSANNHPNDQERASKSAEAEQEYNNQLAVVEEDLKTIQSHCEKTVNEAKELMDLLASHYEKAYKTTKSGANKIAAM
ncbi:unnamed protein product [Anisakis simplex]|uniref:BAR domain-containing protein n=1 Tax=Anisakis simplex TaxID=6269 RepID=A0A0M3JZE0_ANISI|nr:unnamed protein product [Anisakis simplex]